MNTKKTIRRLIGILLIMIVGGLGGILADRYIFPYLSTTTFFSKYPFLKKSTEDTTLINKTEQVYIKEDASIDKISNQVSSQVVEIISYKDPSQKISSKNKSSEEPSKGTGVIVTSDGLIMTYKSAIETENSKFKVIIFNGNTYDADLIGIDSWSNLVFLKISAANLPAASFANSNDAVPGEKIVVIGYGSEKTPYRYTGGLLSFIDNTYNIFGKSLASSEKMQGVFSLDINYNQLYLGGPVADYSGQIIGIVGSSENAKGEIDYFVIPSNKVNLAINRSLKAGLQNNPVLGIYYLPLTRDYALENSLENQKGALIYSTSNQRGLAIIAGSPADKSSLQLGDIITKVNSDEIDEVNSLPDLLYKYSKGDNVSLTVLRNKKEEEISLTL